MDLMDTLSSAAAIGGKAVNGKGIFSGFATDSRDVKKGDMFLCIKGERTDGHLYIKSAEENGASCFLCQEDLETSIPYIKVPNTEKGIQDLARFHRANNIADTKVVAVTGSVGKTTTKELTAAVLASKYKTYKTRGNKNSETGLPITILEIEKSHDAAVTEMGMSNLGEIEVLSKIACPDIGIITNIGHSHIENLGSRENILKAKLEIISGMKKNGILILNGDDEYLVNCSDIYTTVLSYGINNKKSDFYAKDIIEKDGVTYFTAITLKGDIKIELPLLGKHNVYNSLAAIAAGLSCGLTLEEAAAGLKNFETTYTRQNIYEKNGFTIFDDSYNAAPASVSASVDVLRTFNQRKIAVLGDMLELGELSKDFHQQTGEKLAGIDVLISYGNFADSYAFGAYNVGVKEIYSCKDASQAAEKLKSSAKKGDIILFKASRGMTAEKIIESFIKDIDK